MKKFLILIFILFTFSGYSQTACENPICYGQPITLSCDFLFYGGCATAGAIYNWTNVSGSWTSNAQNPIINVGETGYATDRFYLSLLYTSPPGGFSGGSVKVTVFNRITTTSIVTNPTCYGGTNGSINITPGGGGGTPPWTYLWSNGATTEDITGLASGIYKVTVTDKRGCTSTIKTITKSGNPVIATTISYLDTIGGIRRYALTSPNPISIKPSSLIPNCISDCNSSITTSVTGGVPAYTYSWVGPNSFTANTLNISSLCVGTYTLSVTDANTCSSTKSITIGDFDVTETQTNIRCNIPYSGAIYLNPTCPQYTYTYLWDTGHTTRNLYGLSAGTYNVTITNNYGSYISKTYTIQ